jgi:eukaryotic-like serine/threonine-protein kinase
MSRRHPPHPERWRRVQAILEEAFELPPAERAGLLERACAGEPALRAEVEALLAADGEAEGFLDGPPGRYAASLLADVLGEEGAAPPETFEGREIGPYRLLGPLGRGGMGEVFEAYDARLDRTVALKRVQLGRSGADPLRRERFRREARAAAGLSHPGIVPVYDLLEAGGEDWIVMERAEGRNLAELLSKGPLSEPRALELGREVAGALAAAHARGIVHRDLKAENVIVSAGGRARLLDFGIAKKVPGAGAAALEPGLTAEAVLLGTARSMSPEQARGGEVGPRSDLFSLGVLLYEALTGESPFQHPSPAVTLSRVCSWRQPPVCEVNPAVSAETSELVDRLLEKRPEDRPAGAEEVLARIDRIAEAGRKELAGQRFHLRALAGLAAVLLLAAALGALLWRDAPAPAALHVAVLEPELSAGGEVEGEMLVAALFAAVQQGLVALEGVAAVTPEDLEDALKAPVAAARALAADEVLRSRLDCRPRRCQVSLSRLAPGDGRVLWLRRFDVPADDYGLLATAVSAHLRSAYPSFRPRAGAALAELPPGVYERYLRLLQRLEVEASAGDPALQEELAALRGDAPEFVEVYLLEARAARQSFYFSKDRALLDRAFGLLDAAAAIAPHDPRVSFQIFDLARESGRWPVAERALASLRELAPSDAGVLERRADLAAHQGLKGEALALMRQAAELRPSFSQLYNLALMEYQQGEIDAARGTLERLLERTPGSNRARSLLAQFELLDGSLERAVELYDQLAGRSGGIVEVSNRGLAELLLGRFESAAASYRQAHRREPGNPLLALNLADALLLSGEREEARELYRQVVERLPEEPGDDWQSLTARAQALAHLGREREAVATVQRALQLAPDNPQVAYEAAIVYALLGYTAPALVNAERALQAGLSARWFSLPWFDGLRREPAFRALLPPA